MSEAVFSDEIFYNEEKAVEYLESVRWLSGPVCPHCGNTDKIYRIKQNTDKKIRYGLRKCGVCQKQFTVKVGTLFESSHIPLHKWLQATHLLISSKKGISSHQIHRMLGITYKSAWFMTHRIREALREGSLAPFGSNGGTVEVDETFIGNEDDMPKRRGYAHKRKVLSLVDRESGESRSMVVDSVNAKTIVPILKENIAHEAKVMTDDAGQYKYLNEHFSEHGCVQHSQGEYVSLTNPTIHTNTVEGFFSIFKRGMKGVYQHCKKSHLHRYLAEFDFRYGHRQITDAERRDVALMRIEGKRLTYRGTH